MPVLLSPLIDVPAGELAGILAADESRCRLREWLAASLTRGRDWAGAAAGVRAGAGDLRVHRGRARLVGRGACQPVGCPVRRDRREREQRRAAAAAARPDPLDLLGQAAADGKTVRGAVRADGSQVHLPSVLDVATGCVRAQRNIGAKTNEIPELAPAIARQVLSGASFNWLTLRPAPSFRADWGSMFRRVGRVC